MVKTAFLLVFFAAGFEQAGRLSKISLNFWLCGSVDVRKKENACFFIKGLYLFFFCKAIRMCFLFAV